MTEENNPSEQQQLPEMPATERVEGAYGAEQMKYLTDLEHVRKNTGMYIGDTGPRGMHHLVVECVANSVDEAMAGHAQEIHVTINVDESVTVMDDGRGIPVETHPELGISTLEGVMTRLKFGGKFEKQAYKTSAGLHGIGVKAVNFLSEWCEVEVSREGRIHRQEYERGVPTGPVTPVGPAGDRRGTKTTFKPDPLVFGSLKFNFNEMFERLQELAFLNRGVKIIYRDDRSGEAMTFQYPRGLLQFIEHLNSSSDVIHRDILYGSRSENDIQVEVALQYTSEYTENVHTYVNNVNTVMGGTHLSGFRSALTRTLNAYGNKNNMFKDTTVTGEDFREGLTAVIAVRLADPKFESQTKIKLNNPEVEGATQAVVGEFLNKYLEENPKTAKVIIDKALLAAQAREAARKAKELIHRKSALSGGGLPGKLRDCTSKDRERCELFLVEGDSAGGSAEGGRMREFQAILPLRGKIINAYKSRDDKVLANEEIRSMISAIGVGIGEETDLAKRRYSKIVIMTDADVDGSHIRTLLLTFFYRQMYQLVQGGFVYVAQPPLYRVVAKKKTYYVQTDEEMRSQLLEMGLGETTFEPGDGRQIDGEELHVLCKALAPLEDALLALERRGISLREHAARRDPVTGRLPMYHVFAGRRDHWFYTREELEKFLVAQQPPEGTEKPAPSSGPSADSSTAAPSGKNANGKDHAATEGNGHAAAKIDVVDLHEVRSINAGLAELKRLGFEIEALLPVQRTGSDLPRYVVRRGESQTALDDLRGLVTAVRDAGLKGLTVTRFKGLGEMNAEELGSTTLDPANRTLTQVTMADAGAADTMFRVLMGEKVEPRRAFIEKHALEVKNLDI